MVSVLYIYGLSAAVCYMSRISAAGLCAIYILCLAVSLLCISKLLQTESKLVFIFVQQT